VKISVHLRQQRVTLHLVEFVEHYDPVSRWAKVFEVIEKSLKQVCVVFPEGGPVQGREMPYSRTLANVLHRKREQMSMSSAT
jgi:hypothetical protein